MQPLDPAKVKSRTVYKSDATFFSLCGHLPTGKLYAGGDDGAVTVFDLAAEKKEPVARWAKHDNYVSAVVCVPRDAKPVVVSGSYDRHLFWWDTDKGEVTRRVEAHDGWVRDLVATPDGSRLVSVGDDLLVKVWETDSGKLLHTLKGHALRTPQGHVTALYTVAVSPDGKYVASGDRIGEVRVWDLDTGKLLQRFEVPALYTYDPKERKRSIGGIRALAFTPDGSHLAIGGISRVNNVDGFEAPALIELWDWQKPQARFAAGAAGHKGILNCLLFHPAGWLLGGGGGQDNGFLAFWKTTPLPESTDKKDAVPGQRVKLEGHVHRCLLSADGSELYATGHRKLEVWGLGG